MVRSLTLQLGNNSNNHAFILRRYDTNAISLTTMYKVAFPGATEEDERREMDWVSVKALSAEQSRSSLRLTPETPTEDELRKQFDWLVNGKTSLLSF